MRKIEYKHVYNQLTELLTDGNYPPGSMIPSENELCARLNVSRTTIRKALKLLEDEQRIYRKAGLGTFAGSLSTPETVAGKQIRIGIDMTLNQMNNYNSKILAAAQAACSENDCQLKVLTSEELIKGKDIDAAIFSQLPPEKYPLATELSRKIPVLLFNRVTALHNLSYVAVDYEATTCKIISRIINNGYPRIGLVGSTIHRNSYAMYHREEGYRKAFANNNLPVNEKWISDFSKTGNSDFKTITDMIVEEKLDVVFITSEAYFYQVIAAVELAAATLKRYPFIFCFDDIHNTEFFEKYPIACINMPFRAMCQAAVNHLADAVRTGRNQVIKKIFSAHIINNERSPLL